MEGLTYSRAGASRGFIATEGRLEDVAHTYLFPNPTHDGDLRENVGHVPGINPYEDAGVKPFDLPDFNSLRGIIISLQILMIFISLVISVAKPDFNLVLYMMGYYLWCIHGEYYLFYIF